MQKLTYESITDSLHRYKLSNFVFVTESFTFIAGTVNKLVLDN